MVCQALWKLILERRERERYLGTGRRISVFGTVFVILEQYIDIHVLVWREISTEMWQELSCAFTPGSGNFDGYSSWNEISRLQRLYCGFEFLTLC